MGFSHPYSVRWNISPFAKRGEKQDQATRLIAAYSCAAPIALRSNGIARFSYYFGNGDGDGGPDGGGGDGGGGGGGGGGGAGATTNNHTYGDGDGDGDGILRAEGQNFAAHSGGWRPQPRHWLGAKQRRRWE